MRREFVAGSIAVLAVVGGIALVWRPVLWSLIVFGPLIALGVRDMLQTKRAVSRNFPIIGHGRYQIGRAHV